jgi:hypothetical protein
VTKKLWSYRDLTTIRDEQCLDFFHSHVSLQQLAMSKVFFHQSSTSSQRKSLTSIRRIDHQVHLRKKQAADDVTETACELSTSLRWDSTVPYLTCLRGRKL